MKISYLETGADCGMPKRVICVNLKYYDDVADSGTIKVGDVVVYSGITPDKMQHGWPHSGKVSHFNALGRVIMVLSKMDNFDIIEQAAIFKKKTTNQEFTVY